MHLKGYQRGYRGPNRATTNTRGVCTMGRLTDGHNPETYHEGDMAQDIVEYMLYHSSWGELVDLARAEIERDIKSWPMDKIRTTYNDMTGENI